jgi:hypothetical protein
LIRSFLPLGVRSKGRLRLALLVRFLSPDRWASVVVSWTNMSAVSPVTILKKTLCCKLFYSCPMYFCTHCMYAKRVLAVLNTVDGRKCTVKKVGGFPVPMEAGKLEPPQVCHLPNQPFFTVCVILYITVTIFAYPEAEFMNVKFH